MRGRSARNATHAAAKRFTAWTWTWLAIAGPVALLVMISMVRAVTVGLTIDVDLPQR
ncbi:hypothetical protein L3067_02240 [Xanthomonas sp. PPL568]|uniref:hypothetical protein n=1 Tax=Xanthomonas indica TaxID=2912242 RepID=UPI001F5AAF9F|nr:hypothetical protein [Xanthomonas indica]MCI2243429.1 hypothetical protein [Xanthomonas indica]